MIRKSILFLILLFATLGVYSQKVSVNGVITDSIGTPLTYANVIAKPISQDIDMGFSITNENGNYELLLVKDKTYQITVSYLGFESKILILKASKNIIKNIRLKSTTSKLDEVIIFQKIPVIVKEDTIIYDPKVFTTGTERKLKEVLKKLPGVEVDRQGIVTVMGKKVDKLLVDGKTFFGGGTKLGVENIPADAVDGVEVLDNYNEVAFLKGLSDSEKMAMNIKLKEDKKKFVFGDLELGGGDDERYTVHPNLFYYSPRTNINFIGDVNNIGIKSFTIKDYLDFEVGIGKLFADPSSYFQLSNNNFAQFLVDQDFTDNQNKFGAFNITQSINKKLDASSYIITSKEKSNTRNETENQYLSEDIQSNESRTILGRTDNFFLMAKASFDYIPTEGDDISYNVFVKTTSNNTNTFLSSLFNDIATNLNSKVNIDALSIKQNFEWHKKFTRKHTVSFTANYLHDENNPFTNWVTNEPILQNLIPLQNDIDFNINQDKELKINNLNLLFKHYWVINSSNHIYTSFGNNFLKENYITNDFQLISNGSINNFNSNEFGNDIDFQLNDLSLGIQHKFKTGIVTIKYGATLHNYTWKVNQLTNLKKSKFVWLPDFLTKLNFNKSENLNLKYVLRSSFNDAPRFANQFQLVRYNSIAKGNENLENELFHSARLWYTKFSLLRGLALSGSIGYTRKIETIRDRIQLQGIDQFTQPILTKNPETTWTFNSNIRKKFGKLTFKLKGNLNFFEYLQEVNTFISTNQSDTKSFGIEISSNFKKVPNFEIGFDKRFSKFTSASSTSKFSNESPYVNLEYNFSKDFVFKADYSRNVYRDNNNQKNIFEMANASLFYQKEDSPWGFKLSGTNIFGIEFKNRNSFSDFVISDDRTFVLPRIWLFTITYKI